MEAGDGRDVREDAGGDFWRDPCFCQLGTENLSTEKPTMATECEQFRHLLHKWVLRFLSFLN